MAVSANRRKITFLRNATAVTDFAAAKAAIEAIKGDIRDGEIVIATYTEGEAKKSLLAVKNLNDFTYITESSDEIAALVTRATELEATHAKGAGKALATVAEEITAAVNKLNVDGNVSAAVKGVTVQVDEEVGKVKPPIVKIADGTINGTASDANLVTGTVVKNYVDGEIQKIPEATVTGVKADDKFLSLTNKLVGAEVSIAYDDVDKKIYLYGKDKTKANAVSSIDCKDFIKDGMLSNAELVTNPEGQKAGTYIKLTWNTDGSKEPMYIDVTSLIDVYTAGNGLSLKGHEFSVNFDVAATKDSVDEVTGRVNTLESKVGKAAGVDPKTDPATGLFKAIDDVKVSIVSADGAFVTGSMDDAGRKITLSEKIQTVSGATAVKKGLAEAYDVKTYVDQQVGEKNVSAKGDDDDAALVNASATNNTVTVNSTKKLKDAVTKAESALQSVTGSTSGHITTTVSGKVAGVQTITVSATTKAVSGATSTADGLATAFDVQTYVKGLTGTEHVVTSIQDKHGDFTFAAAGTTNSVNLSVSDGNVISATLTDIDCGTF